MVKDYRQLWDGALNATAEAESVSTVLEILADKEGRTFISSLDSKYAELCIEYLDQVSSNLQLPFPPPQATSSGSRTAQPQNRREAQFIRRIEETG